MESKLSKVVSKIWPPGVLTKYTTDNDDDLDSWGVDILKSLEIKYTGYTLGPDNKPRYGFVLAAPPNTVTTGVINSSIGSCECFVCYILNKICCSTPHTLVLELTP